MDNSTKFKLIKDGKHTWIVPLNNDSEKIFIDTLDGEGFGGRTLEFTLEDGTKHKVKGPWHSNTNSLFERTGIDLRSKNVQ